uniref:Uncharacterized protein n=1 Tax=Sinocyclocheilus anshuiensis TaxID=1608454 RepID=A0A671L1Z3_9TELE
RVYSCKYYCKNDICLSGGYLHLRFQACPLLSWSDLSRTSADGKSINNPEFSTFVDRISYFGLRSTMSLSNFCHVYQLYCIFKL